MKIDTGMLLWMKWDDDDDRYENKKQQQQKKLEHKPTIRVVCAPAEK